MIFQFISNIRCGWNMIGKYLIRILLSHIYSVAIRNDWLAHSTR